MEYKNPNTLQRVSPENLAYVQAFGFSTFNDGLTFMRRYMESIGAIIDVSVPGANGEAVLMALDAIRSEREAAKAAKEAEEAPEAEESENVKPKAPKKARKAVNISAELEAGRMVVVPATDDAEPVEKTVESEAADKKAGKKVLAKIRAKSVKGALVSEPLTTPAGKAIRGSGKLLAQAYCVDCHNPLTGGMAERAAEKAALAHQKKTGHKVKVVDFEG